MSSASRRCASSSRTSSSTARSSSRWSRVAASSRASRRRSSNASIAICVWRSISRSVTRSSRSVWRRSHSTSTTSSRARTSDLGPLDRLRDRRLAAAEPLGDLLDRAPALHRLRLELVERLGHRLSGGALELLAQPDHGLALLVGGRAELGRLRLEPRLDVGDRLPVPLAEVGELRLEVALRALEIVGEAAQPLLEPPLGRRELVGERLARCGARARRTRRAAPPPAGAPRPRARTRSRRARARGRGGSPPRAPGSRPRPRRGLRRAPRRRAAAVAVDAARARRSASQSDEERRDRRAEARAEDPDGHVADGRSGGRGHDALREAEDVRRVVAALDPPQPRVVRAVVGVAPARARSASM